MPTAIVTRSQRDLRNHPPADGGEAVQIAAGQILQALVSSLASAGSVDLSQLAEPGAPPPNWPTVATLCRSYCEHALVYYRGRDGRVTAEYDAIRTALDPLRQLHEDLPCSQLRPAHLKAVRQQMIALGWCRNHVNAQVSRIKRMFRWAVEEEMAPPGVYHGVQAVAGLKEGRTEARESEPVKPVPEALVEAVLQQVAPPVAAMIQIQLLTGMRPGEVCIMRTGDIDTTAEPWIYRPQYHKTQHHRHERLVFLGPRSQAVIRPFLREDQPQAYLFSPAEAEQHRRDLLHAQRKTPLNAGNVPGSNRRRRPLRKPGERYNTASYRRSIKYAIDRAFPMPPWLDVAQQAQWRQEHDWHPHQLRHNAATRLRRDFGIDAAQVILGHKTLRVTEVYAEKDVAAARRIMAKVG